MTKRIKYTVRVSDEIARFSYYRHAMLFARLVSENGHIAEVSAKDGLVGQYMNGDATPEFKLHHQNAFA